MSPDAVLWLFSTLVILCLLSPPGSIPVSCSGALEGQCEYYLLEADPFSLSTLLLDCVLQQMCGVN